MVSHHVVQELVRNFSLPFTASFASSLRFIFFYLLKLFVFNNFVSCLICMNKTVCKEVICYIQTSQYISKIFSNKKIIFFILQRHVHMNKTYPCPHTDSKLEIQLLIFNYTHLYFSHSWHLTLQNLVSSSL